jgi:hypothetical protein
VVYPNGSYSTIDKANDYVGPAQILRELSFSISGAGPFTVPEGGRFALEIEWVSAANGNLEIYCNLPDRRASQIASPSSDPGYPIPELSTLVLLGVGLLMIVGYVALRRHA